ncbi:hypothetical protein ABBQ38_009050 [Trebouxia sp. C0009 RCD-2024]
MSAQRWCRGLRPLKTGLRHFHASSTQASGVPALSDVQSSASGFFSKLFGGQPQRSMVPMTEALPDVQSTFLDSPPSDAPKTEMTTLSNGFKIATEATVGPTATLGIYVDAGSVYEKPMQSGTSHLLEYMAFKTTMNRSHFRIVREVEAMGGNVMASASREQIAYNIDVVKSNIPEALEVLSDAVLNPRFTTWEVAEAVQKIEQDIRGLKENPQTVLLEGLHSVAYTGALGRPLICPDGGTANLSSDTLHEFVSNNFVAPKMVLAVAGTEHRAMLELAEPMLNTVAGGSPPPQPESKYAGGDFRQFVAGPLTHCMLGFEAPGGWRDIKGSVVMTVLQYLMGGGGSFSAGGPGKGMHSRLYTRVLNQFPWMVNCTAVSSLYNDTGIFSIFASAESSSADEMVNVLCKELQAVASKLSEEELERAKKATISSVLMNLESRAVVAEDIGRQILTYGHRKPVDEYVNAIRKLKVSDVTGAVSKLLKTAPSLAAIGDIANIPRYAEIERRFK